MGWLRISLAVVLGTTFALASGSARAGGANDRIDDDFIAEDSRCGGQGPGYDSIAFLEFEGHDFAVEGYVEGIGTDNDEVRIGYVTDLPDRAGADSRKGSVSQSSYSGLCVVIDSSDGSRDIDTCDSLGDHAFPQRCSIKASLDARRGAARVDVKCSDTDLFRGDLGLTQAQTNSLVDAFPRNNRCGVKIDARGTGQRSSLSIRLGGPID